MISLSILGNIFAQDTSFFKSKELIIIDSNSQDLKKYGGMNYKKIILSNSDKLLNINHLLTLPSINLNQYGGIGSLSSISIRGTSSNQTIISVNKIPLNNSANPFYDINLLPLELFDEINVISIGNSTKFGSGSIGGVVDFTINNSPKKYLNSFISIGSFGYFKTSLTQKSLIPFLENLSSYISYENYTGNYPIKYNEFGKLIDTFRQNSAYNSFKISNLYTNAFNNNLSINSITLFSSNYQEQPGAVIIGRLEDATSNLKQLSLTLLNSIKYTNDLTTIIFSNSFNIRDLKYKSTEFTFVSKNNFTAFDLSNSINYDQKFQQFGNISFNFGMEYNQLAGGMLQKEVGSFINRTLLFISASNSNNINNLPLSYNISFRVDKMLNYNSIPISGLLAINYFPSTTTKINFSLSKNFRFPSFNEMYYFNYGNIDLLPEKSLSSELSLDYISQSINIQVCGFISDIADKIVSVPKSTLIWTAQNYSRVLNYGCELSTLIYLFKNHLSIGYYYLLQTSYDNNPDSKYYKSLIPYIPNEKITTLTNLNFDKLNLKIEMQRISYRYFLPENIHQNYLPSYFIINSSIKYEISISKTMNLSCSFDINNLTNLSYEIIKNYPMPGRAFHLTIGVRYE